MAQNENKEPWTVERVEARLIAAFRAMPNHPVYSSSGKVRMANCPLASEALGWADHIADRADRLTLWTWARCRAIGGSFTAYYTGLGWTSATAHRRRKRAAGTIVAALTERHHDLDSGVISPGALTRAEAEADLV